MQTIQTPLPTEFFSILLTLTVVTNAPRRWVSQSSMPNRGHGSHHCFHRQSRAASDIPTASQLWTICALNPCRFDTPAAGASSASRRILAICHCVNRLWFTIFFLH